ncbi:MAG TPA: nucleotidyltransferase family protein [Patescibacteria group bacterium]
MNRAGTQDITTKEKNSIIRILKKHNVKKASLFGSMARGEATSKSDVDFLIEFKTKKSLLDLASLRLELEETLNTDVDVLTYKSLHPLLKKKILREQKVIL